MKRADSVYPVQLRSATGEFRGYGVFAVEVFGRGGALRDRETAREIQHFRDVARAV